MDLPSRHEHRRPYLGKHARLGLAPISLAYLSIFALAMSLVLLLQNLQSQVDDAKANLESSCSGVEMLASFAASAPHYAAEITNRATVATVNSSIHLTSTAVDLIVDIAEGYVKYAINTINTPYVCLSEFVIRAALDVLIEAAKVIEAAVDLAAEALVDGIKAAITVANGLIMTIDALGGHVSKISVDTSVISSGVQKYFAPVSWMETLNNSVPTLAEAESALESLFDTPAEVCRTLAVEEALAKASANLSSTILPIPDTQTITFCDGLNTTFLDEVGDSVRKWAIWGLWGLLAGGDLLALILIGIERACFSLMMALIDRIRKSWLPDPDHTSPGPTTERLLGFLQAADHPVLVVVLSSAWGAGIWFATYVTYPPALLFLFVGLLGLAVIQLQIYLLTGRVRAEAEAHISSGLDTLVSEIASKVNTSLVATSLNYANDVNAELLKIQDSINADAFGWVQKSVTGLNNTIEGFVTNIKTSVRSFFSVASSWGDLVDDLITCVIGTELNEVEVILKWMQENAQVSIPTIPSNRFVLNDTQLASITSGLSGTSSGQSATDTFVEDFITRYESVLRVQQYVFIGYIGVWVVVLVFGIVGLACAEVTLEWRTVQWGKVRSKARGWWERLKGLGRGAKGTSRRDRGRRRSESARRSSRSGSDSDGSEMALRKSGR